MSKQLDKGSWEQRDIGRGEYPVCYYEGNVESLLLLSCMIFGVPWTECGWQPETQESHLSDNRQLTWVEHLEPRRMFSQSRAKKSVCGQTYRTHNRSHEESVHSTKPISHVAKRDLANRIRSVGEGNEISTTRCAVPIHQMLVCCWHDAQYSPS